MRIFLLILAILVISEAQVLGIDFGTEFWKASLISPGKNLVIVENSRSGRKTINGIAFHQSVRNFQQDALYKRLKKPNMSYFYLNKLLRSLDFEKPLQGYQFENGTYYITHNQEKISLEQLVGMILKNIKLHASNQAGSDIKDAVLSVPANWGWKSKMTLINAAYIADLSVLGLINQNSAAAIHFAITRNDTDPINIGFFNLGSHNLQFSIIQFFGHQSGGKNIESLRVLSHLVVEDVGGLQVDKAIADHLSQIFKKKHGLDPRTKQKGYIKLLHQASQAKQTLSANKEAIVYVEGIMQGIDLNLPITRDVIESLQVFKLLNKHLDEALQKANLKKNQLNSVEMIGGASRIPLVSKIVKDHFDGIEVGSHINGDQAMAFGSALRAANLSIAFRVKQLHFYDGFEKQIKCVISQNDEVIDEQVLFDTSSQHGDKATVHLSPPNEEIKIDLFYGQELVKTYKSQNVSLWRSIYNQSSYNFTSHPNLVLNFFLSTATIVDLKQSYINITYNKTQFKVVDDWIEEQVKTVNVEDQKTQNEEKIQNQQSNNQQTTNQTQSSNAQSQQQSGSQNQSDSNNQQSQNQNNSTSQQNQNKTSQNTKPKKPKAPRKKMVKVSKLVQESTIQTKKHLIPNSESFVKYPKLTKTELEQNKQILYKFQKHEKHIKQKAKIRNDLQSTLYRLKDSYEQPFLVKFAQQQEIQNLKKVVSQKLQWLDQNAWTAEKDEFQKHYNHVFQAYSPMHNRSVEHSQREKKYNETIQFLSFTYHKTLQLNKTHLWLEDKIQRHLKKINETVEQIHDKLKKQYDQALNQNPLIYNDEMLNMAQRLRDEYYLIKMIPRPRPIKTPKIQTNENQNKQESKEEQSGQNEEENGQDREEENADDEQKGSETQNDSNENEEKREEGEENKDSPQNQQDL